MPLLEYVVLNLGQLAPSIVEGAFGIWPTGVFVDTSGGFWSAPGAGVVSDTDRSFYELYRPVE